LSKRVVHSGEKFFVVERFNEKGHRANLHRGRARGQIVARRDHDNARPRRKRTHSCEDFETSHFFHPNIGHHHRHRVGRRVSEKIFRFVESAHFYAVGSEQVLHRSEDRWIVVHDTDFSRLAGTVHAAWLCESRRAAGRRKKKRAPRSGAFSALIVPP
jgi:hypothetical protein